MSGHMVLFLLHMTDPNKEVVTLFNDKQYSYNIKCVLRYYNTPHLGGWNSSVSKVTGYRMNDCGSIPSRIKLLECKAGHSQPPSAKVQNVWSLISNPLYI
jgi:hypothetical protein